VGVSRDSHTNSVMVENENFELVSLYLEYRLLNLLKMKPILPIFFILSISIVVGSPLDPHSDDTNADSSLPEAKAPQDIAAAVKV
jgi:hypothetical protein